MSDNHETDRLAKVAGKLADENADPRKQVAERDALLVEKDAALAWIASELGEFEECGDCGRPRLHAA